MAEAFARIYGGSSIEAYSAGSAPSGRVNPKAIAAMAELGYDLHEHRSKSLAEIPDVEFDFVATMGCGDSCPHVRAKRRHDWQIPDPKQLGPNEFRQIRDRIESHVCAAMVEAGEARWKLEVVGLVGIGLVGTAIAERLLAEGIPVCGFDIRDAQRAALVQLGGQVADDVASIFRRSRRLVFSLPDSNVVQLVVDEFRDALQPGTRIVDTTTGDPAASPLLAGQLQLRGVDYLDATIVGSSEQVRRREGLVLVSGNREACWQSAPLIRAFSHQSFYLGESGNGARMKLVANLAIGLHRAVLAEALCFAESLGLDQDLTLQVLRSSPAYSRAMDVKGEKMLARDFQPQARLAQHLKDVHLILAQGAKSSAYLPLSQLHSGLLQRLVDEGWGDADNSAIVQAFDTRSPARESRTT